MDKRFNVESIRNFLRTIDDTEFDGTDENGNVNFWYHGFGDPYYFTIVDRDSDWTIYLTNPRNDEYIADLKYNFKKYDEREIDNALTFIVSFYHLKYSEDSGPLADAAEYYKRHKLAKSRPDIKNIGFFEIKRFNDF